MEVDLQSVGSCVQFGRSYPYKQRVTGEEIISGKLFRVYTGWWVVRGRGGGETGDQVELFS